MHFLLLKSYFFNIWITRYNKLIYMNINGFKNLDDNFILLLYSLKLNLLPSFGYLIYLLILLVFCTQQLDFQTRK